MNDCNGRSTNVFVQVLVVDTFRPVIVQRQNVVVDLGPNGQGNLSISQVDSTSSDNCGIVTRRLSRTAFDCSNVGLNQVSFTVEDASGNMTTSLVSVTVRDVTAPTVATAHSSISSAYVSYLNQAGEVRIPSSSLVTFSDNCGIDSIVPSELILIVQMQMLRVHPT